MCLVENNLEDYSIFVSKRGYQVMDVLGEIFAAIADEGFTARTLKMIDNYVKDI